MLAKYSYIKSKEDIPTIIRKITEPSEENNTSIDIIEIYNNILYYEENGE